MGWYLYISNFSAPVGTPWQAAVAQFASPAAYQAAEGYSPTTYFQQPANGYPTQAAAQSAATAWNVVQQPTPTTPGKSSIPGLATLPNLPSVASAIGLGNVDNFFHSLSESSTWIRVGEVVAGLMVVYAALKALTTPAGANPVHRTLKQTAVKIAVPAARPVVKAYSKRKGKT